MLACFHPKNSKEEPTRGSKLKNKMTIKLGFRSQNNLNHMAQNNLRLIHRPLFIPKLLVAAG
jgi:hypothetical protein